MEKRFARCKHNQAKHDTFDLWFFKSRFQVNIDLNRARILKHLVGAEKSTFQGELSFQRSECTAGLTMASFFVLVVQTILSKQFRKHENCIK